MNSPDKLGSHQETPASMPESGTEKTKEGEPQSHREVGGPKGPEPTRYGDWEKGGRCIDF